MFGKCLLTVIATTHALWLSFKSTGLTLKLSLESAAVGLHDNGMKLIFCFVVFCFAPLAKTDPRWGF